MSVANLLPLDPSIPRGFGAFLSNSILKSIGISFVVGGLYSYKYIIKDDSITIDYTHVLCVSSAPVSVSYTSLSDEK